MSEKPEDWWIRIAAIGIVAYLAVFILIKYFLENGDL